MTVRRVTPTILAVVLTAGCLQKEAVHTLYLSPDGTVRWTVAESGVYSDEDDGGSRLAEEQAYIGPALIGDHPAAQALRALGPSSLVDTIVVRDERPFHVITQARFSSVDTLLVRVLKELGVKGTATISEAADAITLVVTLDFGRSVEQKTGPVVRTLEDLDDFRITLTSGRFGDSPGFDINDRVQARISSAWLEQAADAFEARRAIELRLTWHPAASTP
jgi:hypothetical protein